MNIFAGNFTLQEDLTTFPDIDYDILKVGEKTYFIMWAHESIQSSDEVISLIKTHFGELASYDISIESEDKIEILSEECESSGVYESVSFEWAEVSFESILERFAESSDLICLREAQKSHTFWNRVIKADFWY